MTSRPSRRLALFWGRSSEGAAKTEIEKSRTETTCAFRPSLDYRDGLFLFRVRRPGINFAARVSFVLWMGRPPETKMPASRVRGRCHRDHCPAPQRRQGISDRWDGRPSSRTPSDELGTLVCEKRIGLFCAIASVKFTDYTATPFWLKPGPPMASSK